MGIFDFLSRAADFLKIQLQFQRLGETVTKFTQMLSYGEDGVKWTADSTNRFSVLGF